MKAKKSLGQHFLNQSTIAQKIAQALLPLECVDQILEVGPGQGMLTQFLLDREEQLCTIELDRDMIPRLEARFDGLVVHQGDFLKLDLPSFLPGKFHLIGNFPYNISSQILFKMLDNKPQIPQMVGMFQREVAERIVSKHGSKRYGILSVLVQAFYDVEYLFSLGPSVFSPPPRVDSAVVRLRQKENPLVSETCEKPFRTLVKLAFGQRRKMLRNSLKSIAPDLTHHPVGQLRPEQLSVSDFAKLNSKLISSGQ